MLQSWSPTDFFFCGQSPNLPRTCQTPSGRLGEPWWKGRFQISPETFKSGSSLTAALKSLLCPGEKMNICSNPKPHPKTGKEPTPSQGWLTGEKQRRKVVCWRHSDHRVLDRIPVQYPEYPGGLLYAQAGFLFLQMMEERGGHWNLHWPSVPRCGPVSGEGMEQGTEPLFAVNGLLCCVCHVLRTLRSYKDGYVNFQTLFVERITGER